MQWKFYNPQFAADHAPELPHEYMTAGAWSGHRRFAYDLIRFAKPNLLVELGTWYGTSFFSFCQAVKDAELPTRCFAVDTWQGDQHTGSYGQISDVIYQSVQAFHARQFASCSALIRSSFDAALPSFADGSIDILHIDGLHTYTAVLHDLETWLPKVAENGIILFHDTNVRLADFGVHILWEQLSAYPRLHFPHSNGLGVLFPKGCPEPFQKLLKEQDLLTRHYAGS